MMRSQSIPTKREQAIKHFFEKFNPDTVPETLDVVFNQALNATDGTITGDPFFVLREIKKLITALQPNS